MKGHEKSKPRQARESVAKVLRRISDERAEKQPALSEQKSDFTLDSLRSHRISVVDGVVKLRFDKLKELVGRSKPQQQLTEAFNRVHEPNSQVEVVLINGVSGSGKTELVNDWRDTVVKPSPAVFVQARHRQESSISEPFSASKIAFGQLLDTVSEQNDLDRIREVLKETLGSQVEPLVQTFPSLKRVFPETTDRNGDHVEVEDDNNVSSRTSTGSTNYAMKQLGLVFLRVLRTIARPSTPIVLFLDDIQWADDDSLDFISSLLVDHYCTNFMFIGAFRVERDKRRLSRGSGLSIQSLVGRRSENSNNQVKSLSQARYFSSSKCLVPMEKPRAKRQTSSWLTVSTRNLIERAITSRIVEEEESTDVEEPGFPAPTPLRRAISDDTSHSISRRHRRETEPRLATFPEVAVEDLTSKDAGEMDVLNEGSMDEIPIPPPVSLSRSSTAGSQIGRREIPPIHKAISVSGNSSPLAGMFRKRGRRSDNQVEAGNASSSALEASVPLSSPSLDALDGPSESTNGSPPPIPARVPIVLARSDTSALNKALAKRLADARSSDTSSSVNNSQRGRRRHILKDSFQSVSKRWRSSGRSSTQSRSRANSSAGMRPSGARLSVASQSSASTRFGDVSTTRSSVISELTTHDEERVSIATTAGPSHEQDDVKSKITDISLSSLDLDSVSSIISVLLGLDADVCMSLASIVLRKTYGNPHSILQFLEMLQRESYLTFSMHKGRWEWDADRINVETKVTTNVGELLAAKIDTLPKQTLSFLEVAACIGQSFHGEILAVTAAEENLLQGTEEATKNGDDPVVLCRKEVETALEVASNAGFVEQEGPGVFRFLHDLVHKCLYSKIDKDRLPCLHLKVGRLMRDHELAGTDKKAYYAAINHLNLGAYQIDDEEERVNLMQLNLKAGQLAKSDYSFNSAAYFLEKAILIMEYADDWVHHYDLVLEVYTLAAEVNYTCGHLEKSLDLAEEVISHAVCVEDEIRAHFIKVDVLGIQRKLSAAVEGGFKVLELLGCRIPRRMKRLHLLRNLRAIRKLTHRKPLEHFLTLKTMTDAIDIHTLRILDSMTLLMWMMGRDKTIPVMITKMMLVTLKGGLSVFSPFSFASYGVLLSHIGDLKGAYKFGKLALRLAEKLKSRLSITRTALVVYTFTNHLVSPLIDSVEPLLNAHRMGIQVGDVEYSSMCLSIYASLYIAVGLPLKPYVEDMKDFCEQLELHKQQQCVALMTPYWQLALNLMGRAQDPRVLSGEAMDHQTFIESESAGDRDEGVAVANLRLVLLLLACIFQDTLMLEEWFKDAPGGGVQNGAINGTHFLNYIDPLFTGLAAYTMYRETGRKKYFARGNSCLATLNNLVKTCGINSSPMQLLLQAEWQSFRNDIERTRNCYDKAIALFARCGFTHLEALACERAGDFMTRASDPFWSMSYYSRSQLRYLEWGATAKAEELGLQHNLRNFEFGKNRPVLISMRGKRRYDPSTWAIIGESTGALGNDRLTPRESDITV